MEQASSLLEQVYRGDFPAGEMKARRAMIVEAIGSSAHACLLLDGNGCDCFKIDFIDSIATAGDNDPADPRRDRQRIADICLLCGRVPAGACAECVSEIGGRAARPRLAATRQHAAAARSRRRR